MPRATERAAGLELQSTHQGHQHHTGRTETKAPTFSAGHLRNKTADLTAHLQEQHLSRSQAGKDPRAVAPPGLCASETDEQLLAGPWLEERQPRWHSRLCPVTLHLPCDSFQH